MKPDKLLELVASGVLLLVILSLGWIMLAAYQPTWHWLRLPTLQLEVLLILGLFTAALVLVSAVALRQTRG
jgi:hypothetical protein